MSARMVAIVALLAGWTAAASAQVPGPAVADGAFDIGVGIHFIDRELETDDGESGRAPDFHVTSVFFRYGVYPWLTFSGEVAAANTHALEDVLNERNWNSRYVLAGAGVQAALFGGERWTVSTGVHVTRIGFLSREADLCHEHDVEWMATLHAERRYAFRSHRVTVWGGLSHNAFALEKTEACGGERWDSIDDWGVITGADATWFSRLGTFVHLVYAGRVQPRVGISAHFD